MTTQQAFDFQRSTLKAEINRVDISKRAKKFLTAIAELAEDRQSYEGSLSMVAEKMRASYQTARRAKVECLAANLIETIEPPGKVWTWTIKVDVLFNLPSAPEQKRPKRSAPRRRESSSNAQPVSARPEIPRALLSLITLWTWLFGKERTPSTPSTFQAHDPLQMGAPTSAPPPLLSATPSTFGADPLHFDTQPPPDGRAQVRNPLQMSAPTPPHDHENEYENDHVMREVEKSGKRWGRIAHLDPGVLKDHRKWPGEFRRLSRLGVLQAGPDVEARYYAMLARIREGMRSREIRDGCKFYGTIMRNGSWWEYHTPQLLAEAIEAVELRVRNRAAKGEECHAAATSPHES